MGGGRLGMCPIALTEAPDSFPAVPPPVLPATWPLSPGVFGVLSGKPLPPLPQEGSEVSFSLPFVKPDTSLSFVFPLPKFCRPFLFAGANCHALWSLLFSLSLSIKLYYFLIISVVSREEVVINMGT